MGQEQRDRAGVWRVLMNKMDGLVADIDQRVVEPGNAPIITATFDRGLCLTCSSHLLPAAN